MATYLVVKGRHAQEFEAGSVNDAVVQASKVMGSVYEHVVGLDFQVYPVEFAQHRKMQYENPEGTFQTYGEARLVDEFALSRYDRLGIGRRHDGDT